MVETQTETEKVHNYFFPDVLGRLMSKVDLRTQLESGLLSMSFMMVGLIVTMFYIAFYIAFPLWYKIFLIINMIAGLMFFTSNLVQMFQQYQNYPNQFNSSTTIHFVLPEEMQVRIRVMNSLGQWVQDLWSGVQSAGDHRITWQGLDQQGQHMPSGVYLLKLQSGEVVLGARVYPDAILLYHQGEPRGRLHRAPPGAAHKAGDSAREDRTQVRVRPDGPGELHHSHARDLHRRREA